MVTLEVGVQHGEGRPHLARGADGAPGMPNTAMTASPMNFSTLPPWRSITAAISSKRPITRRSASGSSRSPSAVEPVTSANTIVTTFRTSAVGAPGSPSGVAQFWQNRARSAFSSPQVGHRFTA